MRFIFSAIVTVFLAGLVAARPTPDPQEDMCTQLCALIVPEFATIIGCVCAGSGGEGDD